MKANGMVIGIVSNLDDPEGLERVRVKFPHLGDQESDWARVVSQMAGAERGSFFKPEVDDEVLVCFNQEDIRHPYILGALWSQTDKPPPFEGSPTDNNWRFIRSRSGHVILLDDTPGKEKIELIDKDEQSRVVIDSANKKIQVLCESGDVEVKAKNVKIEATTVEIKASGSMNLEAGGNMTIKGATVNIN